MRVMMNLLAGLLFGIGLVVSGMADPLKVQNFLDILGTWDPSLAFVMGGAVVVTFIGYRLAWKRGKPLLAEKFALPASNAIDGRVVIGPAIFGIGWGLGGFCPGPALTALGLFNPSTVLFVAAMLAGMGLARFVVR